MRRAEHIRHHARGHQPVLERVARSRWRLRAIRKHPPLPVGRAREIGRVHVQEDVTLRHGMPQHGRRKAGFGNTSSARQQIRRAAAAAARRDPPGCVLNSVARCVIPASMAFHSSGSISSGIGSSCQGRRVVLRVAVDVVGDAVVVDQAAAFVPAARQPVHVPSCASESVSCRQCGRTSSFAPRHLVVKPAARGTHSSSRIRLQLLRGFQRARFISIPRLLLAKLSRALWHHTPQIQRQREIRILFAGRQPPSAPAYGPKREEARRRAGPRLRSRSPERSRKLRPPGCAT